MSIPKKELELIETVIRISKEAGSKILEIYDNPVYFYEDNRRKFDDPRPLSVLKKDSSPLTIADIASHEIIVNSLRKINPSIPILSEEASDIPFKVRSKWDEYWLIDPLDGTKEFLKRNGEFTVNIALIKENIPILGIIHIPISNETYWGSTKLGSFYLKDNKEKHKISVAENTNSPLRIVASRSHPSKSLESLLKKKDQYKIINKGSSLKLCLIASGEADIYPRFGPTSEWDIAAGQAILESAGGAIITNRKQRLHYNESESYLNPNFVASSSKELSLHILSEIE